MNLSLTAFKNNCVAFIKYLPIVQPAIKADRCEVDHDLLMKRIFTVALAVFTAFAISIALATVFPNAAGFLISLPTFCPLLFPIDLYLSERAANYKAVDEYLHLRYPSKSATYRIQNHLKAAQLLINKHGDLNKTNEHGERLINHTPNPQILQLLVKNGADVKALDINRKSCFEKAIEESNIDFLKAILQSGKISPNDFTPEEQIKFWLNMRNIKMAALLKEHGFDINIRGERNCTPLLKLIIRANFFYQAPQERLYAYPRRLDMQAHIIALLNCGADPSLTVEYEGLAQNALEIAEDPIIHRLLQEHIGV